MDEMWNYQEMESDRICSYLFPSDLERLGNGYYCSFVIFEDGYSYVLVVTVSLGSESTILPGDTIDLIYDDGLSLPLVLDSPSSPIKTSLSISAPTSVSDCDDVPISVSVSGVGGTSFPLLLDWILEEGQGSNRITKYATETKSINLEESYTTGGSFLNLTVNAFSPVFDVENVTKQVIIDIGSSDLPLIYFTSGDSISSKIYDSVYLKPIVSSTGCANVEGYYYQWSSEDLDLSTYLSEAYPVSKSLSTLTIPSLQVTEPNDYKIALDVYDSSKTYLTSQSVTISYQAANPIAIIEGSGEDGGTQSVYVSEASESSSLSLSAQNSYDPNFCEPLSGDCSNYLSFSWSCICDNFAESTCQGESGTTEEEFSFSISDTFDSSSCTNVKIELMVVGSDTGLIDTTIVDLIGVFPSDADDDSYSYSTTETSTPVTEMRVSPLPSRVNSKTDLYLSMSDNGDDSSSNEYLVEVAEKDSEDNSFDMEIYSDTSSTHSLIIPSSVISSLISSDRYYSLTITHVESSLFSTLKVYINQPPSSGVVSSSPTEGIALQTLFALTTEGWVDEEGDLPLTYNFYQNTLNSSEVELVEEKSNSSSLISADSIFDYLPDVVFSTSILSLNVECYDSMMASSVSSAFDVSISDIESNELLALAQQPEEIEKVENGLSTVSSSIYELYQSDPSSNSQNDEFSVVTPSLIEVWENSLNTTSSKSENIQDLLFNVLKISELIALNVPLFSAELYESHFIQLASNFQYLIDTMGEENMDSTFCDEMIQTASLMREVEFERQQEYFENEELYQDHFSSVIDSILFSSCGEGVFELDEGEEMVEYGSKKTDDVVMTAARASIDSLIDIEIEPLTQYSDDSTFGCKIPPNATSLASQSQQNPDYVDLKAKISTPSSSQSQSGDEMNIMTSQIYDVYLMAVSLPELESCNQWQGSSNGGCSPSTTISEVSELDEEDEMTFSIPMLTSAIVDEEDLTEDGFVLDNSESVELPYKLDISQLNTSQGCYYWDELSEEWSGDGCRVSNVVLSSNLEDAIMDCSCNHLTAFAVGALLRSASDGEDIQDKDCPFIDNGSGGWDLYDSIPYSIFIKGMTVGWGLLVFYSINYLHQQTKDKKQQRRGSSSDLNIKSLCSFTISTYLFGFFLVGSILRFLYFGLLSINIWDQNHENLACYEFGDTSSEFSIPPSVLQIIHDMFYPVFLAGTSALFLFWFDLQRLLAKSLSSAKNLKSLSRQTFVFFFIFCMFYVILSLGVYVWQSINDDVEIMKTVALFQLSFFSIIFMIHSICFWVFGNGMVNVGGGREKMEKIYYMMFVGGIGCSIFAVNLALFIFLIELVYYVDDGSGIGYYLFFSYSLGGHALEILILGFFIMSMRMSKNQTNKRKSKSRIGQSTDSRSSRTSRPSITSMEVESKRFKDRKLSERISSSFRMSSLVSKFARDRESVNNDDDIEFFNEQSDLDSPTSGCCVWPSKQDVADVSIIKITEEPINLASLNEEPTLSLVDARTGHKIPCKSLSEAYEELDQLMDDGFMEDEEGMKCNPLMSFGRKQQINNQEERTLSSVGDDESSINSNSSSTALLDSNPFYKK